MPKVSVMRMSLAELETELKRRRQRAKLLSRRARVLQTRLDRVLAELAALGVDRVPAARKSAGKAASARPKRPRNKMILADVIAQVLAKDQPKAVPAIAEEVRKAGYKTVSKSFRVSIHSILGKDKRFKRAGRGQYVLRGG